MVSVGRSPKSAPSLILTASRESPTSWSAGVVVLRPPSRRTTAPARTSRAANRVRQRCSAHHCAGPRRPRRPESSRAGTPVPGGSWVVVVMTFTLASGSASSTGATGPKRRGDSPTRDLGDPRTRIGPAAPSYAPESLPTVVVMTTAAVATAVPSAPRTGRLWLAGWAALVQLVLDVALAVPYLLVGVGLVVGLGLVPAFGIGLVPVALTLLAARG